jgi:hypothetical protein
MKINLEHWIQRMSLMDTEITKEEKQQLLKFEQLSNDEPFIEYIKPVNEYTSYEPGSASTVKSEYDYTDIPRRRRTTYTTTTPVGSNLGKTKYYTQKDVQEEYQPKIGVTIGQNVLNMDCLLNKETLLTDWKNITSLAIQTNPLLVNNPEGTLEYIRHKLTGTAGKFAERWTYNQIQYILYNVYTGKETLEKVVDILSQEFLGHDYLSH